MNMQAVATGGATKINSLSLKEELALLGIRTMNTDEVHAFKRGLIRDYRGSTFYKLLGPVLALLSRLSIFVLTHGPLSGVIGATYTITAFAIMILGPFYGISSAVGLEMLIAYGVVTLSLLVHIAILTVVRMSDGRYFYLGNSWWDYFFASMVWERTRVPVAAIDKYHVSKGQQYPFVIPEHLQTRARLGSNVTGAQIQVDTFGSDPFLALTRTKGLHTETCFIGAWDTGNEMFDSF